MRRPAEISFGDAPHVTGEVEALVTRCNLCGFPVFRIYRGPFGVRCVGCTSTVIHRAVGLVIEQLQLEPTASVYEMSARGALVRFLKRRFPPGTFSEYYDDVTPGHYKGRIRCEDVQQLTYEDESFDLVTSTEVFEHVPDDRRGFHEVYRVLRLGGHFVFSVPLHDGPTTLERAFVVDGRIVHVLPPEYHDDRIRGRRRVLAFRTYGRDIVNRLQAAGFEADIHRVREPRYGIADARVLTGRKGVPRRR